MTIESNLLLEGARAEISALEQAKIDLANTQSTFDKKVMSIVNHVYNKLLKSISDNEIASLLKTESQNSTSILSQLSQTLVDKEGRVLTKATFCCSNFCLQDKQQVIEKVSILKGDVFSGLANIKIQKNDKGYCFVLTLS
ncbi:MAG: hypothetical protein QG674_437 [Patescibacteria group bacterium]|jgi:hypothetical protein|nr:hypothetical protein [Patescibacteria group bacterium]